MKIFRGARGFVRALHGAPFRVANHVTAIPGVFFEPTPTASYIDIPMNAVPLESIRSFLVEVENWIQQEGGAAGAAAAPFQEYAPGAFRSFGVPLYQHQIEAARFINNHHSGVLLGDQLGLGKTRSALAGALQHDGVILIIGPKYLRAVWEAEIEKCGLGHLGFHALRTTRPPIGWGTDARFVYCHYDIVHPWWSWLSRIRPKVVIVDEAHNLRNSRTKRSKGTELAAGAAEKRILLTGTPLLNRVGEIWNLLNLTTGKWTWGTPTEFRMRYAGAVHGAYGLRDTSPTNIPELRARLSTCYLRRTLEDVPALELPAISREVLTADLTPKDLKTYRDKFDGRDLREVFKAILQNRASTETLRLLNSARKLTSRVKLPVTCEAVQSMLAQHESVVVFTWQRSTAERIAAKFARGTVVHGGLAQDVRDQAVRSFQAGKHTVLAATYDSLSTGVTLTKSRVVILHDLMWRPADLLQAEGRVYRISQTRPVSSKWVVAAGTLDEFFANLLLSKVDTIAEAMGDLQPTCLEDIVGGLQHASVESTADAFARSLRDHYDA